MKRYHIVQYLFHYYVHLSKFQTCTLQSLWNGLTNPGLRLNELLLIPLIHLSIFFCVQYFQTFIFFIHPICDIVRKIIVRLVQGSFFLTFIILTIMPEINNFKR